MSNIPFNATRVLGRRPQLSLAIIRAMITIGLFLSGSVHANAQMRDEDPAASQALAAVIKAVRSEPRVIRETVIVSTIDGDEVATAPPSGRAPWRPHHH